MKILITGMTSSQVNETTKRTGITVVGAMAQALRMAGHTVEVRPYRVAERPPLGRGTADFDHVMVGLGPLKGIGTSYMYGAIQALADSYQRASLFVDDTATLKIGREFKTILRRPDDYVKPFFVYKREWNLVCDQESDVFLRHMEVISTLAGNDENFYWPFFVPSWNFDLAFTAGQRICMSAANNAITFDPSAFFAHDLARYKSEEPYWATFWAPELPPIKRMGVQAWEVEQITRHSWQTLSGAEGTLIPSSIWAPEAYLSASVGIPVAADWKVLGPQFGEAWEALPANIEVMSADQRQELAGQQRKNLLTRRSTEKGVSRVLSRMIQTTEGRTRNGQPRSEVVEMD